MPFQINDLVYLRDDPHRRLWRVVEQFGADDYIVDEVGTKKWRAPRTAEMILVTDELINLLFK